ncbi:hypothetical protein QTP86_023553 [Hemibagrus guttatus]|nr:hypothetical protein QTP86_023553 [Hemibagrus guttatus]
MMKFTWQRKPARNMEVLLRAYFPK